MDFDIKPAEPQNVNDAQLPEPTAEPEGKLSPDQLAQVPEIAQVLQGAPPAIKAAPGTVNPLTELVKDNMDVLTQKMPLGLYKQQSGWVVLFNTKLIPADKLPELDQSGELDKLAVPIGGAPAEQAAPAESAPQQTPQFSLTPPAPTGVQEQLNQARLNNMKTKTPTTRAIPGGGTILDSLGKRAI